MMNHCNGVNDAPALAAAAGDVAMCGGASPLRPPILGMERPNHFELRNIPDVERIMAWSKDCHPCRAVGVGGVYIGLETAEHSLTA